MKKQISVTSYNSDWPLAFAKEAEQIHAALGSNCVAVHHVGSTAVPGLCAKDKIDIVAEVKDRAEAVCALEAAGYEYRGEWNVPFKAGMRGREGVSVNLHVFEAGHPEVELNVLFRDYLRAHPDARDEYARLKEYLLADESSFEKPFGNAFSAYNLGKDAFIQEVLAKTGFSRHRFLRVTHYEERRVFAQMLGEVTGECFLLTEGLAVAACARVQNGNMIEVAGPASFADELRALVQRWLDEQT